MSLEVVVHLEVGTLLVDDCAASLAKIQADYTWLVCLTGGSSAHVCGCEVVELRFLLIRLRSEQVCASLTFLSCVDGR